ncbi:MAG: Lrp/AsnC ligand binding domain-containing protein [Chloroflexi bacterium]|nr:Lrp/AsnC ligand binding domain-containing protein [Chloroflexota bacterium]
MGTKAYFMINMDKTLSEDGYYVDAIRELEAIPEIESVEAVSGTYDLVAKVDAPIRVVLVASKVLEKKWVRRLHVLQAEPVEREAAVPHVPKAEPAEREATIEWTRR